VTSVPTLDTPRGHTQISSRAMTRLVSAVAAEALGIASGDVSVDLAESHGELTVTVRAPLGSLADGQDPDHDDRGTAEAEERIRGTVTELTGATIAAVTVRQPTTHLRLPIIGD
jgi:hypothetical protein